MPIYEYECESPKCGHHFEALQKMSDDPITKCPACKSKKVRKMVSASSFVLKGSGWYQTTLGRKEKAPKEGGADKPAVKADAPACAAGGCGSGACGVN